MQGIMIMWGKPVAGRERLALEEFASYVQWIAGLKAQGKIGRFELYMPQFGDYEQVAGFSILEGSADQISQLVMGDDFKSRIQRVLTVAHSVRTDLLDVGAEVAQRMQQYGTAIKQLKL